MGASAESEILQFRPDGLFLALEVLNESLAVAAHLVKELVDFHRIAAVVLCDLQHVLSEQRVERLLAGLNRYSHVLVLLRDDDPLAFDHV